MAASKRPVATSSLLKDAAFLMLMLASSLEVALVFQQRIDPSSWRSGYFLDQLPQHSGQAIPEPPHARRVGAVERPPFVESDVLGIYAGPKRLLRALLHDAVEGVKIQRVNV